MPMRLLCLHGWGTNVKKRQILQSQLAPLMKDLQRDNSAVFHFIEGEIEAEPGPGIDGYFDGPYYSYYKFPRTFDDTDESMMEAYELLYDVIEEDGPFDGVMGFSHGGTLASGFLIHHAKTRPYDPPPFRCAIFLNSLPPFRMNPGESPVVDADLEGYLTLPTLSIAGKKDFVFESSVALYNLCDPRKSQLVVHENGHDVPRDPKNIKLMAQEVRKLFTVSMYSW
ncbi:hypothetical protein UA08_07372 [Talaromyces atroroseus]|uniref:Serine hydrolase domain-containing protein n=1 Tax=Talaromyces atroroseus TaxID=1441469 RepID=A0A225ARH2_TALAT|nr:hypothetical protein UA08_07372 [Talaromyces atroroseus]OKL57045.1 hypothetical protein UA08_07372 [Talaromyces atroroseus]